jgi:lambda family phage portal protein
MSLISRSRAALRALFPRKAQSRGFQAAQMGRLYADWFAHATSSDAEIRGSLRKLIDRSRDLERNNDYQRGFLLSCERNILGAIRTDLRMDCGEYSTPGKGKPPVWQADRAASAMIERAWLEWGTKGTCTVCGRYSWRDVKRLAVRATPRDGNFLARKIYGAAAKNRFGFALQIWEIDHLDLQRFDSLRNGHEIRFGIESDASNRVVAFWLKARHPGDLYSATSGGSQTIRVGAEEVYHLFISERAEQSVGIPWVVSAITRLRQLGAFEEAAVIAARLGASKAGFFKKIPGPNGETGDWVGETNTQGHGVMDAAPGTFEELPQGWALDSWNPEYPNIETSEFRKAMLRGVGTSLGISYTTLGNDIESVNFSSARVGMFEEREGWKSLQVFYCEGFWEPVFGDWLPAAMLSGAVPLPLGKLEKFNRPVFKARRWPFIDPLKEVSAAKEAISLRLSSRRQFIEESGGDVDDVFHDNLADEQLAEEMGLSLTPADPMPETFGNAEVTAEGEDAVEPAAAPGQKPKGKRSMPITAKDIAAEVIRQTPAREAQPQSTTVNIPAPVFQVKLPERMEMQIPAPIVNVNVPEQREQLAPVFHVNVPEQPAPVVNVTVPAPVVHVEVPRVNATLTVARDASGKINGGSIS